MADPPFIVRAWPTDQSKPPVDMRKLTAEVAIESARQLAWDSGLRYRSVIVTDDQSMVWAQFNMLWSIYEPV